VLTVDRDDSEVVLSSGDEDDDASDEEIAACSELFDSPAPLPQPDTLPGIESGERLHCSVAVVILVMPNGNNE